MKVYIPYRTCLNNGLIEKEFEIVNNMKDADVVLAQSTLPYDFDGNFKKVIYLANEPPRSSHRFYCYSHFDDFKLVVAHNADTSKPNQINFTDNDEAQYYPYNPVPGNIPQITREDTTIKTRGVFFAGMIGPYENQKNLYGGINLTKLRRKIGNYLMKELPPSKFIGIGWNGQTTKVQGWRGDKFEELDKSKCDFVLALENTALDNYISEKIWDGLNSDRVTLYLGDKRIEHHIPTNCFIDLRMYFHTDTGEFDFDALKKRLLTITQKEYDRILFNARAFRKTAEGKHREHMDKLTNKLIQYIKDEF
jgi:hypothetical protein